MIKEIFEKNKLKLIIAFSVLILLFGGCVEKTITINADNYSTNVVQNVLSMSDKNITKYINSITVYENEDELNKKCKSIPPDSRIYNHTFDAEFPKQYVGCTETMYESNEINANMESVNMFILSDNKLEEYCDSEGNTLFYLMGQVEYTKTYTSKVDGYNLNLYAEEYANKYIKNKCSSDEYLNLFNNYNIIENNFNLSINKFTSAKDKYNSVIRKYNNKWNYYLVNTLEEIKEPEEKTYEKCSESISDNGFPMIYCPTVTTTYLPAIRTCNTYSGQYCGIPEDRYNEYVLDFNEYSKVYDDYSKSYDVYSNAYNESLIEYNENSNKINETLKNYRYPFETIN